MVVRGRVQRSDARAEARLIRRPNLLSGERLPSPPRQKRSLEKRERLKSAALDIFRRKGYHAAAIDEIARKAGLPVGGFYQHYRSKRQLLLALMDEMIAAMARLDLRDIEHSGDTRSSLRDFLARAFSGDFAYLGAYRAWQEAALSDPALARHQRRIRAWTLGRVIRFFRRLETLPGARKAVDIPVLARAMDLFFWNLLGEAVQRKRAGLDTWLDAATHLIYHALFTDPV